MILDPLGDLQFSSLARATVLNLALKVLWGVVITETHVVAADMSWVPEAGVSRRVSQRQQDTCDCAACRRSMSLVACRTMTLTRRIVVICLLRSETVNKNRTHAIVRTVVNICLL